MLPIYPAPIPLTYTVPTLSQATGIGQSNIWEAIRLEELEAVKLVVGGEQRRRTLIRTKDAQKWVDSFPKVAM